MHALTVVYSCLYHFFFCLQPCLYWIILMFSFFSLFLPCFLGDRINGNTKKGKKKINLLSISRLSLWWKDNGWDSWKISISVSFWSRKHKERGVGWGEFISLLSHCILLLSFDMISIGNYWPSRAGCPIALLRIHGLVRGETLSLWILSWMWS